MRNIRLNEFVRYHDENTPSAQDAQLDDLMLTADCGVDTPSARGTRNRTPVENSLTQAERWALVASVQGMIKKFVGESIANEHDAAIAYEELFDHCLDAVYRAAELHDDRKGRFTTYTHYWLLQARRDWVANKNRKCAIDQACARNRGLKNISYSDRQLGEFDVSFDRLISCIRSPRDRDVLDMRFRRDMSFRQIAETHSISHARVKQIIDAALHKIRKRYHDVLQDAA